MDTIAHCLIWYLPLTMGYIYDQLLALKSARSVVFAAHAIQPERFPFDSVYILPPLEAGWDRVPGDRLIFPAFDVAWRPIVRAEQVALLHVHDGRIAPAFLPLARYYRIPIVTSFLGRDVTANLDDVHYLNALRLLFSRGDSFTVMSHDMAAQVQRLGCPEHKIRVIHHGIPLSRFPFVPRRAPTNCPMIILTAGRLIAKKGPDDLARAFGLVCREYANVRLRIVGEGPLQGEVAAILREAGVSDRAEFLGHLEPVEVAREMSRAHLFCLPSRVAPDGDSEGIPNVLKEAMATGLPIVSTYHAGIPELVEDGVSGYLVPERDIIRLADRLSQLLDQPALWEPMGRAGRAKVEAEFSLESVVRQLDAEVYRPLLSGASQPAANKTPAPPHCRHRI
jgi:colanic acid/amylovoran biosynthesis glycosyltransferase